MEKRKEVREAVSQYFSKLAEISKTEYSHDEKEAIDKITDLMIDEIKESSERENEQFRKTLVNEFSGLVVYAGGKLNQESTAEIEQLLDMIKNAAEEELKTENEDLMERNTNKKETKLGNIRRLEHEERLVKMDDRDLCEMIRAHFESHPTLPGEKIMKDQAHQILAIIEDSGKAPDYDKEILARQFAKTRIRETPLKSMEYLDFRTHDPSQLKRTHMFTKGQETIERVNAELQLLPDKEPGEKDTVYVMAETDNGLTLVGTLPDKFLTNNPMNVNSCKAELQITDYSGGKMKNLSARVVVDTDLMSGDVIDLDEDMLNGLNQTTSLEQ